MQTNFLDSSVGSPHVIGTKAAEESRFLFQIFILLFGSVARMHSGAAQLVAAL